MSDTFPGQNTDFFVVVDGQPKGPFKGLRSVFELNISPDTPIWYEGIGYWTPAAIDPVVRQLFDPMSEFYQANPDALDLMNARSRGETTPNRPDPARLPDPPSVRPAAFSAPQPAAPSPAAPAANPTVIITQGRPKSFLIGSILIIVFMSLPCGVISLIYSFKTRNRLRDGNIEAAFRASEISQLWIAIGIVVGLIEVVAMPFFSF